MAVITLLSAHVHDESYSANLFNLRLIYTFRSLPLVNRISFPQVEERIAFPWMEDNDRDHTVR